VRPNRAFGPIDSLTQYLLYLSVVILGIAVPILIQTWRQKRTDSKLATATLDAIRSELEFNREHLLVSHKHFTELRRSLDVECEGYVELWKSLRQTKTTAESTEIAGPTP
jgi:hypothetical protein